MDKSFKRMIMVALVALGFGFSTASAQFAAVVTDPGLYIKDAANLVKELQEAGKRLGVAKEQVEQFNEVYKQVRGVVQGVQAVDRAYQAINGLKQTTEKAFTTFRSDRFLLPSEKVAIINISTGLLTEATKEIKDMTKIATDRGSFLQMTDKERIDMLNEICDTILELKVLGDYIINKYASASQIRSNKYYTGRMFDVFNGYKTTLD